MPVHASGTMMHGSLKNPEKHENYYRFPDFDCNNGFIVEKLKMLVPSTSMPPEELNSVRWNFNERNFELQRTNFFYVIGGTRSTVILDLKKGLKIELLPKDI